MKGYDLTRAWYNYKFANPDKVRHIHSDMYFYLVDKWNRLGQTPKFGLPTEVTMQALNIGSYNTYKKCLQDLIGFGFVIMVQESKNQYHSKIVALSKIDKATDEALDKATAKATDEPTDTINKQRTKNKEEDLVPKLDQILLYNRIIDFLNLHTGKKFKSTSKGNQRKISARLNDGYKEDDFYTVIKVKTKDWLGNSDYEKYLCPDTLFGEKFDKYINEAPVLKLQVNDLFTPQQKQNSEW